MDEQDCYKRAAALAALDYVTAGMVVGLGTGSTAEYFVRCLAERAAAGLAVRGVATSRRTEALARQLGIALASLNEIDAVDLTVDGADEIVPATLDVIKGRGGALLREKLVARASRVEIIAADASKLVPALGTHHAVPVEVTPFGVRQTTARLRALGAEPQLRRSTPGGDAFVTDNGNLIVDCCFSAIADPAALERAIKLVPGVIESGLFVGIVHRAVVAGPNGVQVFEPTR